MITKQHCGFIVILGRSNVGKSTLLNRILGQKISITSRKPQTTRHKILGIKTVGAVQAIYVDTPGLHRDHKSALNHYMNKVALSSLHDVDVVIFMVSGCSWNRGDEAVLEKLKSIKAPVILVVNKIDELPDKKVLLPHLDWLDKKMGFAGIFPVSSLKGIQINVLEESIQSYLPEGPHLFNADQLTDKSESFLVAEIVREKATRLLGQELPYALTVSIESFETKKAITHISAIIWVEKVSQKVIVIGRKGEKLKAIGTKARIDIEKICGKKVFLQLYVKVKRDWSENTKAMQNLGYN